MAHFWGNLKARLFGGIYYDKKADTYCVMIDGEENHPIVSSKEGRLRFEKISNSAWFRADGIYYTVDKNGKKNGEAVRYAGETRKMATFKDNLLDGPFKYWVKTDSGNELFYEGNNKNGKVDGKVKNYNFFSTEPTSVDTYKKGEYEKTQRYEGGELREVERINEYGHRVRYRIPKKSQEHREIAKKLDQINEAAPASPLRKRLKEAIVKEFRATNPKSEAKRS